MKPATRKLAIGLAAVVASIAVVAVGLYLSIGLNENLDRFNPLAREHKAYIVVEPDARKVDNIIAVDSDGDELPFTVDTIVWANGAEFYAINHKGSYVASVEPLDPEGVPAAARRHLESLRD
ncbi:hypothetical protein [Lolliginicoccus suaedae]|uniref:hypothetical protein n=1 Tax=Lolliginicoccus suaedae TaxID=2605429 RepID=UPI0011EDDF75|nr:hypothetical protein [Lolliginicoccus suaedae]